MENKMNFLQWLWADKMSIVSICFIATFTIIAANIKMEIKTTYYVALFFGAIYAVIVIKLFQGYSDYKKGIRR
jgi:1,4-dihydroxy-2-naphthoate octaprenyltransferase